MAIIGRGRDFNYLLGGFADLNGICFLGEDGEANWKTDIITDRKIWESDICGTVGGIGWISVGGGEP